MACGASERWLAPDAVQLNKHNPSGNFPGQKNGFNMSEIKEHALCAFCGHGHYSDDVRCDANGLCSECPCLEFIHPASPQAFLLGGLETAHQTVWNLMLSDHGDSWINGDAWTTLDHIEDYIIDAKFDLVGAAQ